MYSGSNYKRDLAHISMNLRHREDLQVICKALDEIHEPNLQKTVDTHRRRALSILSQIEEELDQLYSRVSAHKAQEVDR